MGKKKNNESNQQQQQQSPSPSPSEQQQQNEGKFLLGKPKFKRLENGRYKCVQTGHELPAGARESYALTKHCRLGLIDSALARNKPPLNMFNQDPLCRSKLICKLTGHTVNKSEEHIWKHITGKRFLNALDKQEADKEASNCLMEEEGQQKPEKASTSEGDGLKKKKKKKKKEKKKNKKRKEEEENDISKIISEVRNPEEKDSDTEEAEFWMPPEGDRWDFDDGKDRWGSDLESDVDSEDDDAIETDVIVEETKDTQELSKRTKRMSIVLEPSDSASKKKKKTQST